MLHLNVKEMLKKRNKTKYWLVQNMHSDYKTVSDMIENKTSGIKFGTIEKLCNLLDCTPNDIFKFNDNNSDDSSDNSEGQNKNTKIS